MRNLLIVLVLGLFAWQGYGAYVTRSPYHCDGRVYCSQMTSRDEAEFFLANCPGVKMDGGDDGVPCILIVMNAWRAGHAVARRNIEPFT